jgi:hypothetical protein
LNQTQMTTLQDWAQASPLQRLQLQLEAAISYEEYMRKSLSEDNRGFAGYPFMPAALVAYRRILHVLTDERTESTKAAEVRDELLNIFTRQHYPGVQLRFICQCVDAWLESIDHTAAVQPSTVAAYEQHQLNELSNYGPPTRLAAILLKRHQDSTIAKDGDA